MNFRIQQNKVLNAAPVPRFTLRPPGKPVFITLVACLTPTCLGLVARRGLGGSFLISTDRNGSSADTLVCQK